MSPAEFSNEFDVLYNNIMSNQAPGLDEYEKSVFLTKAQNEVILSYFNPKLNKVQEGFDGSAKRQVDFSNIIKVISPIKGSQYSDSTLPLHLADNAAFYEVPDDLLLYINEFVDVSRGGTNKRLAVVPLSYTEYNRLMSKPFTRPLKNQAWRLMTDGYGTGVDYKNVALLLSVLGDASATEEAFYKTLLNKDLQIIEESNKYYLTVLGPETTYILKNNAVLVDIDSEGFKFEDCLDITAVEGKVRNKLSTTITRGVQLIPGPADVISTYVVRYIKRPPAIVLESLSGDLTIEGIKDRQGCILDPILHPEILQRAVELAKAAYVGDLSTIVSVGNISATEKGIVSSSKS